MMKKEVYGETNKFPKWRKLTFSPPRVALGIGKFVIEPLSSQTASLLIAWAESIKKTHQCLCMKLDTF